MQLLPHVRTQLRLLSSQTAGVSAWGATVHASSLTAAGLQPDDISASQELLASPAVTRLSVTVALYVWMHYLLHTHQADAGIMRGACGHVATLQAVGRGKRRNRRPTPKGERLGMQRWQACIKCLGCVKCVSLVEALAGLLHRYAPPHASRTQHRSAVRRTALSHDDQACTDAATS
jgi:hypothetical protein